MAKGRAQVAGIDYGPGSSGKAAERAKLDADYAKSQGGAAPAGGPAAPAAPANPYTTPQAIFSATAQKGMEAGKDPTTAAAQAANQRMSEGGAAAAATGGSGFEKYNPILDRLDHSTEGQDNAGGQRALSQFLAQAGYGPNGPGDGGGTGPVGPNGQPLNISGGTFTAGGGYTSGGPVGIPDTAATPGTFSDYIKQLLAQKVDSKDIQGVVDASSDDAMAAYWKAARQQDAAAQGGGRFGGGSYHADLTAGQQALGKTIAGVSAGTRLTAADQLRQAQLTGAGQLNSRDIAAANDATQRYGIATSAATSGAATSAQQAATIRAQNLAAIQAMLGHNEYSTSLLQGLGAQSSKDQTDSIGAAPGLAGISLAGVNAANAAGEGLVNQNQVDAQKAVGMGQVSVGRANVNLGRDQLGLARDQYQTGIDQYNAAAPSRALDDYMRTILAISGTGGSTTTTGTNVVPGLGLSPTGAAIQGGIGTGLAAYGAYNAYANR